MALNKVAPVVPPVPIVQPAILDESTMTPVQPVEPVKPFISPALQAKMDAKKPVQPVIQPVTPAPIVEETKTVIEPAKPIEPVKTPEISDVEKNAQASGVKYAMQN